MNKMFRRFLATGAAVVLLATTAIPANAAAEKFRDVPAGSWYYKAVDYASSVGLFNGTSATTFSPSSPMTRGMFVTVLGNKEKIHTRDYPGSSFTDVSPGQWYTPYVQWASANGLVNGVGGGKFAPNQSVTREQIAVILYRYAQLAGCDMSVQPGVLTRFPDSGQISSGARTAMEWAITHKIICGTSERHLTPRGTASRAQVAQIFYNSQHILAGGGAGSSTTDPTLTPTPAPTSTPEPGKPQIPITDEVRAKLKPNQIPEQILDYVLNGKRDDPRFTFNGTTAKWDPTLATSADAARTTAGSWEDVEDEMRGSAVIANGFVQRLTRTAADRFYITANDEDGCFRLYYHPAEQSDSQKMREVKAALKLPGNIKYSRSLCYEGAGWAGPLVWDQYGGAQGVANKIKYYLTDMHQAVEYYLTEPTPGTFYLMYGE